MRRKLLILFSLFLLTESAAWCRKDSGSAAIKASGHTYGIQEKSPDRKYALVWRMRHEQVDFERAARGEEGYYRNVGPAYPDYEEGIVDCRSHTLIALLPRERDPKRLHFLSRSLIWDKKDRYVVILDNDIYYYQPALICTVTLRGPHRGSQQSLLPTYLSSLRAHLTQVIGPEGPPWIRNGTLFEKKANFLSKYALEKDRLVLNDCVYVMPNSPGWDYTVTTTLLLDNDGHLRGKPIYPQWILAHQNIIDKGNSNVIAARFDDRGRFLWRTPIFETVRTDILAHARQALPASFFGKDAPAFYVGLQGDTADTVRINVTITPDSRHDGWHYSALMKYRMSKTPGGVDFHFLSMEREFTEQDGKPTARLGIPDHPLVEALTIQ